jgi:alpha-mannosidase
LTPSATAAACWLKGERYPAPDFGEAWRAHLFNDFHDILTGTCTEPAEQDAIDQYGKAEDRARGIRLAAVAALTRRRGPGPDLRVTVANANPSLACVPVEFECMADYRPFWKGKWRLRLFRADGREIPCQEEQPEALLPFNDWRRRVSFVDDLPGVGVASYFLNAEEMRAEREGRGHVPKVRVPIQSALSHRLDRRSGLVMSLKAGEGLECLAGPLLEPLVIEDTGDSWGTDRGSFRKIVGRFEAVGPPHVIADGPVRTITRSMLAYGRSRIVMDVHSYPDWPALEFKLRIEWNEERRRLKLRVPSRLRKASLLCEVPGGAVGRPGDGQEHVHGRWLALEGLIGGLRTLFASASPVRHLHSILNLKLGRDVAQGLRG